MTEGAERFFSWGLPAGRLFGVRIRIHWSLLLFWLYELDRFLKAEINAGYWALFAGTAYLAILAHEFGHVFAARAAGGDADEVLLWPLGGLAWCRAPNVWRKQLAVAAGGPLVTLVLWGASLLVFRVLWPPSFSYVRYTLEAALVDWQAYVFVFNAIPLFPFDGGRIVHAILWGWFERREPADAFRRAVRVVLWTSRLCAVLGIGYGLKERSFLMIILFLWGWGSVEDYARRVARGELEDESFFGHDFSRGYASLERGAARRRGGFLRRWRKRREEARARRLAEEQAELDRLLGKISRSGMGSLTDGERRFLEEVSRKRRGGRDA